MNVRACICILIFLSNFALAQTTAPTDYLGGRFTSEAAGVSLRPPAGVKESRGKPGSGEIVQFADENRKWQIKLNRVLFDPGHSVTLTTSKDADGNEHPGMLETTAAQFTADMPGTKFLRQDTTNLGEFTVGMLAARFSFGLQTNLLQEAVVHVSDAQYYILSMTSPTPRDGDPSADPDVRLAVETFSQMLDSLHVIDQTKIREDRNDRLFRTRTLFVNLNEAKLRSALVPQQWWRILKDGKDIGYTYVVQEVAHDLPRKGKPDRGTGPEGILIGLRTRLIEGPTQTDVETWDFTTFDRKYEAWSTTNYTTDPKSGKTTGGELGVSRQREKPVADETGTGIGAQKSINLTNEYRLEVTKLGRNIAAVPIVRDLPPFYIPQAISQLLPRLIPTHEPKAYIFAAWVPSANELMYRYADVGSEEDAVLPGVAGVRAVPVRIKDGLEGAATTFYIGSDGKFLGSLNLETRVAVMPSDATTLAKLWANVDLSRPEEVEQK